ncbi:hypothetical protein [Nocardioides donggukensis]|uniref:Hemerythrin-like domain-containing protein n=1 Tax=Nocardioides donggukensis TaxID=2774019 RepID=A0A927K1Z8_9ACTN|nr:hypothetical protein [Nocardioides donggukensis]MBD8868116.1 hypothetical protein [Nocardioides donggukensis]
MQDPVHNALHALRQVLDASGPHPTPAWRWEVRRAMAAVRDSLVAESPHAREVWLVAREHSVLRERRALLARLAALGPAVLDSPDPDRVRHQLARLVADVAHHRQRMHDLAYDEVELEIGGSE